MRKKVLAIDDDQDILYTLKAIGDVAKLDLVALYDAKEALAKLKDEKFDLVIVDYYMPEMNGLELVERIRNINANIPILVLTVDESLDIAKRFVDAGATDFATKPIRTADLISRINLHLELSQLKVTELPVGDRDIPKGMSAMTMELILDYLKNIKTPESTETISVGTGLAYQTVHRYLAYFEQESFVEVDLSYGKVGRPIKKYKWTIK